MKRPVEAEAQELLARQTAFLKTIGMELTDIPGALAEYRRKLQEIRDRHKARLKAVI